MGKPGAPFMRDRGPRRQVLVAGVAGRMSGKARIPASCRVPGAPFMRRSLPHEWETTNPTPPRNVVCPIHAHTGVPGDRSSSPEWLGAWVVIATRPQSPRSENPDVRHPSFMARMRYWDPGHPPITPMLAALA